MNALTFRLWLRRASAAERATTGVVMAICVALLGWALWPVGSNGGNLDGLGSVGPVASDQPGSPSIPGVGQTPGTPRPGVTGVAPTNGLPGGPGPFPGGPPSATGGPLPTPGGPRTSEARTASDRGITANTIKVGFSILNVGGLNNAGYATGIRTDIPAVVDALVDAANKKGGVNGRRIVADKVRVDVLSQSDQRAKCLQLTETDKVFAAIDVTAFVSKATQACVTVEHKTPFVHSNPLSTQFMRQGYPYDVSVSSDQNRIMKNWVVSARRLGYFQASKGFAKLGLLTDDCVPEGIDDKTIGLRTYLHAAGVSDDKISEFRLPCDVAQAAQQVPQAVLQHKVAGVTLVFPATAYTSVQTYLQTANAQGFKPRYYASDYRGLARDPNAKNFNQNEWDRTQAMTALRTGETAAGKPLSGPAKACSKILTDHGLPGIAGYDKDSEALGFCENFELFLKIATRAGVNPTRLGWGYAVPQVGKFYGADEDLAIFDRPGKVSGGDTVARVEWRKECTCWVQISGFAPAYG